MTNFKQDDLHVMDTLSTAWFRGDCPRYIRVDGQDLRVIDYLDSLRGDRRDCRTQACMALGAPDGLTLGEAGVALAHRLRKSQEIAA